MSEPFAVDGYLEKNKKGFGFLRNLSNSLKQSPEDTFVPAGLINRFGIEDGTYVEGQALQNKGKPAPALKEITALNGVKPMDFRFRKNAFQKGLPITPVNWVKLEYDGCPPSCRLVDIVTPLGKGQRALIAAPPRTGKTVLLENMIKAVQKNHPEMICFVLLVDERPEEVTHFRRTFPDVNLLASSNDNTQEEHIQMTRKGFGVMKSVVEQGKDVILFMDSLTRLCRAYNSQSRGGRTMSGGIDSDAMTEPKRLFGAARQIENGGSLTIVATALIETDSQMDEVIFREFKGTGNLELMLDRSLSDKNIYPAVNINPSGTRNEHLLFGEPTTEQVQSLRRALADGSKEESLSQLLHLIDRYPTNEEFLKLQI